MLKYQHQHRRSRENGESAKSCSHLSSDVTCGTKLQKVNEKPLPSTPTGPVQSMGTAKGLDQARWLAAHGMPLHLYPKFLITATAQTQQTLPVLMRECKLFVLSSVTA